MSSMKTVLVIEDEKGIRNFIHNALTTNGYRTILAENGKNGRASFLSQCPDLVLLDLGLPDMDGIDLLKDLRQWSGTPILIVSARDKEAEKVIALDLGADDYITKPFGISELMARVRTALRHRATVQDTGSIETAHSGQRSDRLILRSIPLPRAARRYILPRMSSNVWRFSENMPARF